MQTLQPVWSGFDVPFVWLSAAMVSALTEDYPPSGIESAVVFA